MDEIEKLFAEAHKEKEDKIAEHKKHLDSKEYKDALDLLNIITHDFIKGIKVCSMYSLRGTDFRNNSLSLNHIDDYLMSAIMILAALKEGGINPAKREMRYLIDSSMRYLYVDQQLWRATLDDKLAYFDRKIDKSNIKYINNIDFHLIKNSKLQSDFCSEYKKNYGKACEYVHASTNQIKERFSLYERGITIGYERAENLREVTEFLSEIYAALLVFTFHAAGVSTVGDAMVETLSPQNNWVYNGNKYISQIDSYFDYKHERQEYLSELVSIRSKRAWPDKALK